ncbi:MAG: hypothetical protein LBT98_03835 [Puniceicoccales bacterium]|nr:hypothetical protein [Puniceicoccales bacterium]
MLRMLGQAIPLAATALAMVAMAITLVLFWTTACVSIAVLWPVAIGCGCVIPMAMVAFALVRHVSGNGKKVDSKLWPRTIGDMDEEDRKLLWQKIRTLAQNSGMVEEGKFIEFFPEEVPNGAVITLALDWGFLVKAVEDKNSYDDVLEILRLLPSNLLRDIVIMSSDGKTSIYAQLFRCCERDSEEMDSEEKDGKEGDKFLVQLLELLVQHLSPGELLEIAQSSAFALSDLRTAITERTKDARKISMAWNDLLTLARFCPGQDL